VASTVCEPDAGNAAVQLPALELSVTVHSVVPPSVMVTVPVAVGPEGTSTVVERVTS
jgi:hypothetical protein